MPGSSRRRASLARARADWYDTTAFLDLRLRGRNKPRLAAINSGPTETEATNVSAANACPDAPIWDEHALDELREIGGDELVKRVVRQSIRDAEERIEELNETCPDASTWHGAAHALHGIALSIGAIRLSQVVADTFQREKLEHAQNYVVEFAHHFSEVREILASFLA